MPLQLETKIPLGSVRGRIDHLAIDLRRNRLFVAELGNDSLGVIDVEQHRTLRTLRGLHEPQGIGYVPSSDTLYVANAADGSVRMFRGANLTPAGDIALGDDADNVRVDDAAHRLFVGYGSGALAVIDTTRATRIADIALDAHPESFRLEGSGHRILVNVPGAAEIAVVDRAANRQIASWSTRGMRANFPLALDESHGRFLAVFRQPAKLAVFRSEDGRLLETLDTCRDSDDAFIDGKRGRVYVICGEGAIDTFEERGTGYVRLPRTLTIAGARTGLFVPELDRLYVAARASARAPAAVWTFRPLP